MLKFSYWVAAPVIAGAVALAMMDSGRATSSAGQSREAVECEVRVSKVPGGVELEAIARADRNVSVEYEFAVEKRGGGGSSDILQGGAVSLKRQKEEILGSAALGLDRRSSFTATLTVEGDKVTACEAEASD